MNKEEILEVHHALHDPNKTSFIFNGEEIKIEKNKSISTRFCIVNGHKFMTQNLKKKSKWAELAREGRKVTHLITSQPWGTIVDDEITRWCSAFKQEVKPENSDENKQKTMTNSLSMSLSSVESLHTEIKKTNSLTISNNNNNVASHAAPISSDSLPACLYGSNCYRKNPQHFQAFSHPPEMKAPVTALKKKVSNLSKSTNNKSPFNSQSQKKHIQTEDTNRELQSPPKKPKLLDPTNFPFIVNINELELGDTIGQGAFGAVKKGKFRGTVVAIKILMQGINDKKTIEMFHQEANLLCKLRHPHIVSCLGIVVPTEENSSTILSNYCMIMEYLPMDLKKYIRDVGSLLGNFTDFMTITRGMALGINYLHKAQPKIIHRDLKPANILLDKYLNPKIADFGVSREKIETSTMTRIGTPHYMAPEILQAKKYSEKVDVYSFGMILWQLLTGKIPFSGMGQSQNELNPLQVIMKATIENARPEIPPCSSTLSNLIQLCWHSDPTERPSIDEILNILETLENSKSLHEENLVIDNSIKTEQTLIWSEDEKLETD